MERRLFGNFKRVFAFLFHMIIALIGPRSVGKSSVGKILAKLLHWRFVEFDSYLNNNLEGGIKGFTDKQGWDKLDSARKKCFQIFLKSVYSENMVLDWGGSIFGCKNVIKKNTRAVLLLPYKSKKKSIEILFEREKKRPHFSEWGAERLKKKVADDYEQRLPLFKNTAQYTIYREGNSPKETAAKIKKLIFG